MCWSSYSLSNTSLQCTKWGINYLINIQGFQKEGMAHGELRITGLLELGCLGNMDWCLPVHSHGHSLARPLAPSVLGMRDSLVQAYKSGRWPPGSRPVAALRLVPNFLVSSAGRR
jgi:hypothetical protein